MLAPMASHSQRVVRREDLAYCYWESRREADADAPNPGAWRLCQRRRWYQRLRYFRSVMAGGGSRPALAPPSV
jgi:hypothetical protein